MEFTPPRRQFIFYECLRVLRASEFAGVRHFGITDCVRYSALFTVSRVEIASCVVSVIAVNHENVFCLNTKEHHYAHRPSCGSKSSRRVSAISFWLAQL